MAPKSPGQAYLWPPSRQHHETAGRSVDLNAPATPIPSTHHRLPLTDIPTHSPNIPPESTIVGTHPHKKIYKRGYEVKPSTPSSTPYALNQRNTLRQHAFTIAGLSHIEILPQIPIERGDWQVKALETGLLKEGQSLQEFQVEAANTVIGRKKDMMVVAPTGQGKSLVWMLPLLIQKGAISLVVTPYRSLGKEGETKNHGQDVRAVYVFSEQKDGRVLEGIASGYFQCVYVCPEMMECRMFQPVLHSSHFKQRLSAIYIDESHLPHEAAGWRPAMSRLHLLRKVVGDDVPIVGLTATAPPAHRESLIRFAGMRSDYHLINLGNFRPELSLVVAPMQHDMSTFQDLTFLLPLTSHLEDLQRTIVYSDDIDRLTAIFWWFTDRLRAMGLDGSYVDIVHAGLSEIHQELAIKDFMEGRTIFLLGTEKIANGINLGRGVCRMVQVGTRGLTICQLLQKLGRLARLLGEIGVGYVLVEESMQPKSGVSVSNPGREDPALLELIHSYHREPRDPPAPCCDEILDRALQNPPRPADFHRLALCCSNCYPELLPGYEYRWIIRRPSDFMKNVMKASVSKDERGMIADELRSWRKESWQKEWRGKWREHGPRTLIPDASLDALAQHASTITTVDDLRPYVRLPFWNDLSQPLFESLIKIYREVCKITEPAPSSSATVNTPLRVLDVLDNPALLSQLPQTRVLDESDNILQPAPKKQRGRPPKEPQAPLPLEYEMVFDINMTLHEPA